MAMKYFTNFLLLTTFVLSATVLMGQTQTQNNLTVEEIVSEFLLGEGIEAFNVTYNGFAGNQIVPRVGTFTSEATGFPIEEGMVMTTKNVQIVTCGPANDGSGSGNDPDLAALVGAGLHDVTIVEFDFIPSGDSINFDFIFASREYNVFVCSQFNDVFGFFLSGPGISGTFSNGAENIALLPDGTPVTINNVNNGSSSGPCTNPATGEQCPCNSEFFIDQGDNIGNGSQSDICFGGYTVPLTAKAQVICGEIYHIKLAIANVLDGIRDSGVFFEKGSFSSNLIVDLDINPVLPGFEIGENDFQGGLIAGCTNAQFCLFRADTLGIDSAVFTLGGSAIPGVQYIAPESNVVFFPPGVDTVCVDIITIGNDLGSQVDSLTVTAVSVNACGDTVTTTASILVYNEYSFPVTTTDVTITCPQDLVNLTGSATNGLSPYTYEWFLPDSTTEVGQGQTVAVEPPPPGSSQNYILSVTDACGLSPEFASITVTNNVQPDPIVSTSPNDTINCVGQTVDLTATGSLGQGDLAYSWSTGESTAEITVGPDGSQTITWYFVTVTDECGLTGLDSVAVYFIPLDNPVAFAGEDVTVICAGDEVTLTGTAEGGAAPYQFIWQGFNPGPQITVNPNSTQTYFLVVTDDCGGTSEMVSVDVIVPVYDPITISLPEPTSLCAGDTQTLTADVEGGAGGYQYSWDTGQTNPTINVSPTSTNTYTVTVTDICEETSSQTTTVIVPVYQPIDANVISTPVCTGLSITLSVNNITGGAGTQATDYSFAWDGPGNFGNVSPTGTVTVNNADAGAYTVLITDVCGSTFEGQVVSTLSNVGEIPNVITPNNDQINDHFVIPGSSVFSTKLILHDRWGKVVYESDNYRCDVNTKVNCWNAQNEKGDVYYYLIDIDGGLCSYQGYVHVLDNQ